MKRIFSSVMVATLLFGWPIFGRAQAPNNQQSTNNRQSTNDWQSTNDQMDNQIAVAEGAQARLALQTQLSSKLSEVGDEVTATLYEAVRGADGRVVIPRGTEFTGRVRQVQPAQRPQK